MWKLKFNLKAYLSTAALPGQTTKTALTEEFMFQNVAYRPTVYITGPSVKDVAPCLGHVTTGDPQIVRFLRPL